MEREALRLGIDELLLYTPKSEEFYRRLQWELVERTVYHETNISVMRKRLSSEVAIRE